MKAASIAGLVVALAFSSNASASARDCHEVFAKPGFMNRVRARLAPTRESRDAEFDALVEKARAMRKQEEMNKRTLTEIDSLVSMEGTVDNGELNDNMLPRGSALLTSSGILAQSGIKGIIHAATGAMTKQGGHYEPTLQSIELSVTNAVRLAERNGAKKIAIPLLGGGIFLQRLGIPARDLAMRIIGSAMESQSNVELHFVAFGDADIMTFKEGRDQLRRLNVPVENIHIDQGSITDFKVHGAEVIVNAANTEVRFGGGLSGIIAKATENSAEIDAEAANIITSLRR